MLERRPRAWTEHPFVPDIHMGVEASYGEAKCSRFGEAGMIMGESNGIEYDAYLGVTIPAAFTAFST